MAVCSFGPSEKPGTTSGTAPDNASKGIWGITSSLKKLSIWNSPNQDPVLNCSLTYLSIHWTEVVQDVIGGLNLAIL